MYEEVGELDFPQLEREVLEFWERAQVFARLRAQNAGKEKFSFFDGPITANNARGLGVHHAWGRTYKDVFQRYKAMLGYDQRYQNGFDCQGLWVEVEVEKALGLDSKRDILTYGLDRFAAQCREKVQASAKAVVETSRRLGQWMDWQGSYYTYDDGNVEHIWHFLKVCHEQGWLYKGHQVMPWCTRCGTSLSQHELADAYKEVTHTAVAVRLPLCNRPGEWVVVWTTTPWTLVANTGLAVHPELQYARVRRDGQVYYMVRGAVERVAPEGVVEGVLMGAEMVGWEYGGPFDRLPVQQHVARRVVAWTEVGEDEGSGVVHLAPGCGAEDYALGEELGLAVLAPLDEDGVYLAGYGALAGEAVGQVGPLVLAELREQGLLFAAAEFVHRYPHCWRCGAELVFRLVDEWFLRCDEIRPLMIEAARQVQWVPEHAGKQMEDWLHNMGDWCISRKRYWGLPLPFYEDDKGELLVVGSRAELKQRALAPERVDGLPELHRPWVDAVEIRMPSGAVGRRVVEVGDCWLDAGVVPFSTLDYMGGDRAQWAEWFPADFVVEMREQIRLWFYSQLFMAVTLEGRAPYRTVMCYEKMHDGQGQAMHKSQGNALWFDAAVEQTGAEPMRWLFAGQNLSLNIHFGDGALREVKRRFMTLWNVYKFYVQYANLDGVMPERAATLAELCLVDRWLLARLQALVGKATTALDGWDLPVYVREVESFVDELSNWYVRLNRRRFWRADALANQAAAHWVLWTALMTLCRLLAPVLPFLSEAIYGNLRRGEDAPASVHLCAFPTVAEAWVDAELVADTARVQQVVGLARALRKREQVKVRQPLKCLWVEAPEKTQRALDRFADLVQQELNVKAVAHGMAPGLVLLREGAVAVALDLELDAALVGEGLAREFVQRVQRLRRENGLALMDRIRLQVSAGEQLSAALGQHRDYICGETLCVALDFVADLSGETYKINGQEVVLWMQRVD